jgi:NAD(P)-dependent dehydrogenase (short-subunit alcohol dehydrogenase family)
MADFGLGQRLSGKVAIITGAGNGIGACTARLFAAHGARVIVADRDDQAARATASQITADGNTALALHLDVTSESQWNDVVQRAVAEWNTVDILVNNAGVHTAQHMSEISSEDWNRHLSVNLSGPFYGIQRVVPVMLAKGGGVIVNVCSIAALIGASFAHYSAAKAGLRALTRTTAATYAKQGIRANAIFPGLIQTNLTREALADPGTRAMLEAATLLPRFGEPRDIAFGILFLACSEGSFATGSDLILDGGVTAV